LSLPGREGTVRFDTLCGEPLGLERFLRLASAATSALADLHRRDLVHHDIQPHNLEIDLDGEQVWIAIGGKQLRAAIEKELGNPQYRPTSGRRRATW
jgi:hypothetical protein